MKKILVLTSGGDSSGMNAYIKSLAKLCDKYGVELVGSMYGYQGLIDNNIVSLKYKELGEIENLGGSILKTSRSKEFMTKRGFNKAISNIKNLNINCVVILGGNGSFLGAKDLHNAGVNIIAIPGTIDNDLFYTDKTLGYETACENALDAIIKISQTMNSTDRGSVIEIMGRHCPDISIYSAILSNADMLITENISFEEILKSIKKSIKNGANSPLIIVRENILNVNELAAYLEQKTKKEFRANILGYIQRGGKPTQNEKLYAIRLACETIKLILEDKYGLAIGLQNNQIINCDILEAVANTQNNQPQFKELFEFYKK